MTPLYTTLDIPSPIRIFDIGAARFENSGPFDGLIEAEVAQLVGFEPNPEEYGRLIDLYPDQTRRVFYPHAIADGRSHELRVCRLPGCSSLLEPNILVASQFQSFAEWMEVRARLPVDTLALDTVPECGAPDMIKLDIQGAELLALRGATQKLSSCLVVECEVEFVPQYVDQPLFSEIELYLRGLGLTFHSFRGFGSRYIKPSSDGENLLAAGSQWLWSDALFVRDPLLWPALSDEQLKKIAVILGDLYGAHDFAARALSLLGGRDELKAAS